MRKLTALLVLLSLGTVACAKHSDVTVQNAGTSTTEQTAGGATLIASGTRFYGKLDRPISTKTSQDGSTFTLTQTDTLMHKNASLHGDVITGHIEDVRAAGPMHKPGMTIVFDNIQMPDGTKAPVNVRIVSMNAFEPKSHHLRTLGLMVGGAVAGHMAASKVGTKHGGVMGAAGGYALSQTLKTDISVPAGSVIAVQFQSPVTGAPTAQST
ncbi:MAG: hypothetical protein M3R51_06815 [Candidatus Eremiobacteraeota bacterium]|nr:hypothetical protein [Candidatus Eremiobacteraeota bacterium]